MPAELSFYINCGLPPTGTSAAREVLAESQHSTGKHSVGSLFLGLFKKKKKGGKMNKKIYQNYQN